MKTYLPLVALLLMIPLVAAQCGAAPAQQVAESKIMVMEPFARASIPNGAVYMTLKNEGSVDDALVSAASDVAEAAELHESKMDENGVMKMGPVPNIPIPAGGSATLQPGGFHIMLMGLKKQLAPGDKFSLTLNFEHAAAQTVEVEVTESLMGEQQMNQDMNMGKDQ